MCLHYMFWFSRHTASRVGITSGPEALSVERVKPFKLICSVKNVELLLAGLPAHHSFGATPTSLTL